MMLVFGHKSDDLPDMPLPSWCCSAKVVGGYRECGDAATKKAAKAEIQGLIDEGVLKVIATKHQNGHRI